MMDTQLSLIPDFVPNSDAVKQGKNNPAAKLNDEQVAEIRAKLAANVSAYSLARRYRVSEATISYIRNNRTWSHV